MTLAEKQNSPTNPFAIYKHTKMFSCLDGMRGLSIIGVIWHHTAGNLTVPFLPMLQRGMVGVDLFFVISGFLIVTLLLREQETNGQISIVRFYIRRFFRIFPLYYAVLGMVLFGVLVLKPNAQMRGPFLSELPYYVTYLSNWHETTTFMSIAWSLATEEQFYLIWPQIQKHFYFYALPFLSVFILINQAVNFGVLSWILDPQTVAYLENLSIVQCTFTPICLGVLLAFLLHKPDTFQRLSPILGKKYSSLFFLALFLIALNLPGADIQGFIRLSIQCSAALWIGSLVIREDNALRGALTWPAIRRVGVVSYGMYLYHMMVIAFLSLFSLHRELLSFILVLLLTTLVAEISYRYFELPFLNIKRRFE